MAIGLTRPVETRNPAIDSLHQQLFELIVKLDAGIGGAPAVRAAVGRFGAIFTELFPLEEALMVEVGYSTRGSHAEDHAAMLEAVDAAAANAEDALGFMVLTAAGHMETMDVPLGRFVRERTDRPRVAVVLRRSSGTERRAGASGAGAAKGAAAQPTKIAAKPAQGELHNLQSMIRETYTTALISLKTQRGMTGDIAKATACKVVAEAVLRATGRKIRPESVEQFIASR